jgi:hypothetical protein
MIPEGPYYSPWSAKAHFIIRFLFMGKPTWGTVVNGEQPNTAIPHESLRAAREDMKRNGYELKTKKES